MACIALTVLVVGSAAIRFAASLGVLAPWIAPDEMVYALLGRSFWETGEAQLFGLPGGWYGFYPYVAGLPLAAFGPDAGLTVLRAVQAVLVSLTAVVVYAWARRIVSRWWALSAATMSVAMPALAYSGLIMTEAAFLPATTLALSLLARALSTPTWKSQALAAAGITLALGMRFQAIALVPAAITAIVLMAVLERERGLMRRFLPALLALAAGVVALMLARLSVGQGGALLGSYAGVLDGYELARVLRWSFWEAGDVFLIVVGLPLLATSILAVARARERFRPEPNLSALLAVALSYAVVSVVQIGAFASVHVQHLAQRDLITVAPPLFIGLTVWLSRGMPRPQPAASLAVLIVAVPALFLPARELIRDAAVPDALMALPWRELARHSSLSTVEAAWPLVAGLTVCAALLAPRRVAPALAIAVVVVLGGASVVAQRTIMDETRIDRARAFGVWPRDWIDRAADGPVAYLDDGVAWWNDVWHQAYWNERVTTVARLTDSPHARIHGGLRIAVGADGTIRQDNGDVLGERLVVAPGRVTLVGDRVETLELSGRSDLALWRTAGAPTLAMRRDGTLAKGPVLVTAYDCDHGYLELTVRAVEGLPAVALSVDAQEPVTVPVKPGNLWRARIAVSPGGGQRACVFRIVPRGLVAMQKVTYHRGRQLTIPEGALRFGGSREVTHGALVRGASLAIPPTDSPVGYCLDGRFLSLTAGQAESDPAYHGATVANFVAGKGLTCDPPPEGFVHRGFATADMDVPAGTYPYYAPP